MGKKRELSCLIKRDLLNQPVASVENLLSWGQQYEEYGLLHDAVEFYEKAQAKEALFRLLEVAQEEGDTFLFLRLRVSTYQHEHPVRIVGIGGPNFLSVNDVIIAFSDCFGLQ